MTGASAAGCSATACAKLLTGRAFVDGTGLHVDFNLAALPSWRDSYRADWQDERDLFVRQLVRPGPQ